MPPAQAASVPGAGRQAVKAEGLWLPAAPRCGLGISSLAAPALCPLVSELEGLSSKVFPLAISILVPNFPEPPPAPVPSPAAPGGKIPSQVPA